VYSCITRNYNSIVCVCVLLNLVNITSTKVSGQVMKIICVLDYMLYPHIIVKKPTHHGNKNMVFAFQ